ncbi:MAG: VCBS repeat-containing protein, partial [Alphaproteobacteria bacterium]|nr:VCBS repeat-containing protein [Alphaproteobacteria bacterium]
FKLSQSGGVWSETVLHTFCPQSGCADGTNPVSALVLDTAGNLYGTTYAAGGSGKGGAGAGVVFKLSQSGGMWTETVLYTFCPTNEYRCVDGANPYASLVLDPAGNLYGTTTYGGNNNYYGTVFEVMQYPQPLYAKPPDINGDGRRDIVWRFTDGTVGEWLMNADGTFQAAGLQAVPNQWQIAGSGDFNHDGVTDLLWRCIDATGSVCPAGQVAIWLMNPDGSLKQAVGGQTVPLGWAIAGTGDFNGDGVADILWRCTDATGSACPTGQVAIWLMNIDGTIKSAGGGQTVPLGWTIAGLGDFNADGVADILWRCIDGTGTVCPAGQVGEWLMNPDGSLKASVGGQIVSPGWSIAGTGDFNADGVTDILWRCTDWASAACPAGQAAIWLMNPDGSLKAVVGGQTVPLTWTIAGTGDFNADGIADILWRYTDGTVVEWLMNPDGTIKSAVGGQVAPLGWAIIE